MTEVVPQPNFPTSGMVTLEIVIAVSMVQINRIVLADARVC